MSECLPDMPRYIRVHVARQQGDEWQGADHKDGPWWPITAPQSGLPWSVASVAEQSSVAQPTDAHPLAPSDRLAMALCSNNSDGLIDCKTPCWRCRRDSAAVTRELSQILRERHGGSSQVADWLDGVGTHP